MKSLLLIILFFPNLISGQTISTFCGNGVNGVSSEGVPATSSHIVSSGGGILDNFGNYYLSQNAGLGQRVSKINTSGIITTIAGTGVAGYSGDGGSATLAKLNYPGAIAVDSIGNLYIPDGNNNRIRKVNISTGIITTIAGTGASGSSGDGGPATAATLNIPFSVAFDKKGNLYIGDADNGRVRKINSAGFISTIAGTNLGFSGDGGPGIAAQMNSILAITFDSIGNLLIADEGNRRIRKMDTFGIITTIAGGTGSGIYNGDGILDTSAELDPYGMAIDSRGNLFIADGYNNRIRKIDSSGIISTVVGTGVAGYSGDGIPATAAQIYGPDGVAIDACGNLYIDDNRNFRIRKVTYPPVLTIPSITLSAEPTSALVGTLVTITAAVTNAGSSYLIHWLNHGIQFATTTVPSVTYTKPPGIDTITARVVSTATYGCYDSTTSAGHTVKDSTVGVPFGNPSAGLRMTVWPNPVRDNLTLTLSKNGEGTSYRILSIVGVVLQRGTLNVGDNNISVQSLPAGIYMMEVTNSDGVKMISKFIKQ